MTSWNPLDRGAHLPVAPRRGQGAAAIVAALVFLIGHATMLPVSVWVLNAVARAGIDVCPSPICRDQMLHHLGYPLVLAGGGALLVVDVVVAGVLVAMARRPLPLARFGFVAQVVLLTVAMMIAYKHAGSVCLTCSSIGQSG